MKKSGMKQLNELFRAAEYSKIISTLEFRGLKNITKMELTAYFNCARRQGDNPRIAAVLKRISALSPTETVDTSHADFKYISMFSFMYPRGTIEEIVACNAMSKHVDENHEFFDFESRLCEDSFKLQSYIEYNYSGYMKRSRWEYRHIQRLPLNIFPYRYLSDYYKPTLDAHQEPNSISFIYCVKNRSRRTLLSVESLVRAYEKHMLANGPQTINIEIILVEDVGEDMVHRFPLTGAHRFIKHFVVDTHVSWTRSGLLNFGLKRAKLDTVAFCDVDFLFPDSFFDRLTETMKNIDLKKRVLAVNCIETETHQKDDRIYSKWSPYGYMWVVDRELAVGVNGFNESYRGHGFEDRDFEHRLKQEYELEIVSSHGIDSELVVLHFSHNVRTGKESRVENRARYLTGLGNSAPPQHEWGEQDLISSSDYSNLPLKGAGSGLIVQLPERGTEL